GKRGGAKKRVSAPHLPPTAGFLPHQREKSCSRRKEKGREKEGERPPPTADSRIPPAPEGEILLSTEREGARSEGERPPPTADSRIPPAPEGEILLSTGREGAREEW